MNKFIYQKDYPVVQTKEGALRGYEWKGTCIFKGIPYAHAQRFRKPERIKPWDGVKDVQSYGYVSPLLHPEQPGGNGEMMVPHMYWSEKEDCQNLNIWTPSIRDGRKRPVMVWLHGGGFSAGSSIEQLAYDGENLSRAGDVVVVSVNHRLNVLGYLDLSPFGEKYRDSANAGNLDLIAALEWIRDNIEGFGGDPENVTLFGQSGGGVKVWSLLQMPEADGLFHKGIIESGVLDPDLLGDAEDGNGREIIGAMLAELGLEEKDVDQLETLPYDQLAQAYENAAPKVAQKGEYVGNHPHKNQSYFGDAIKHGFREETKKIPLLIVICVQIAVTARAAHTLQRVDHNQSCCWMLRQKLFDLLFQAMLERVSHDRKMQRRRCVLGQVKEPCLNTLERIFKAEIQNFALGC